VDEDAKTASQSIGLSVTPKGRFAAHRSRRIGC